MFFYLLQQWFAKFTLVGSPWDGQKNVVNVLKSLSLDWLSCFCTKKTNQSDVCLGPWNRWSLSCRCKILTLLQQPDVFGCSPRWWNLLSHHSVVVLLFLASAAHPGWLCRCSVGSRSQSKPFRLLYSNLVDEVWDDLGSLCCHLEGRPSDWTHQGLALADTLWHWAGHHLLIFVIFSLDKSNTQKKSRSALMPRHRSCAILKLAEAPLGRPTSVPQLREGSVWWRDSCWGRVSQTTDNCIF